MKFKGNKIRLAWLLVICMVFSMFTGFSMNWNTLKAATFTVVDGDKADWNTTSLGKGSSDGWASTILGDLYLSNDSKNLYFWIDTNIPNWGATGMYVDLGLYVEDQEVGDSANPWGNQYNYTAMAAAPQYHVNIRIAGDVAGYSSLTKSTTGSAIEVVLDTTSNPKDIVVKGNRTVGIEGSIPLTALGVTTDSKIHPIVVLSGNTSNEHGAFNVIPEDSANMLADAWNESGINMNPQGTYANTYTVQASSVVPIDFTSPTVSGKDVIFKYMNAEASNVYVAGSFNNWNQTANQMILNSEGLWETTVEVTDIINEYKFVVNGKDWVPDPKNNNKTSGGNSLVYIEGLIQKEPLEVKIGEFISLPKVKYYKESQQVEEVEPVYSLVNPDSKLSLSSNVLNVAADYPAGKIQLKAEYNSLTTTIEVNAVTELIKSPVINPDGTVTFNIPSYTGEKLYIAGTVEGEDWDGKEITKNEKGMFSYTTKNPVAPGKYEYKFKLSNKDWNGSFKDPLNPGTEDNSILIVPGLVVEAISVQKGVPTSLPTSATLWDSQGKSTIVTPSYALKEPVPTGVTLENGILTVDKTFTGNSVDLMASSGDQELVIKVEVVSQLYTYKINYYRPTADYTDWSIWTWETGKGGVDVSFATELVGEFKQALYKVPSNALNFKFKKGDWKGEDGGDRIVTVPTGQTEVEVWCVQGDEKVYYSKPDLTAKVQSALADSEDTILVSFNNPITALTDIELKDVAANQVIATTATKISDTSVKLVITDGTAIDVTKQYTVSAPTFKASNVLMRKILDDDAYYYSGDDLGMTYSSSSSTFKLWAPTATKVEVVLYDNAVTETGVTHAMTRQSAGVWTVNLAGNLAGKFYTYTVYFADGSVNKDAMDPYAKSASVNGKKAAIIDLNATNPAGFYSNVGPAVASSADAIVYELHVRDMSIDPNAPFINKGKYLAFTEKGLTLNGEPVGIDHLKKLGITHVQLLPIYDFGSVDEASAEAQFNWGYDPQNYNVPEGSYATDPTDPVKRVNELKQMINALHEAGIGVIMDVVYNHTFDTDVTSPFNKVVPGYYYRTDDTGKFTNGSGCGNEVASERPMVRKFIKDSAKYWASEYNLDGFRFDLMGLIDIETMKQITSEIKNEIKSDFIIYGEPWTGGSTPLQQQTVKGSQKGQDFGVFNDEIRGAIKGDSDGAGKGFATGATGQESSIVEGVKGAINTFATNPTEVVSYVTAHDNLNLWDKVLATMGLDAKTPYASITGNVLENEAVKRSILANGIALTSQGTSFIHAGEEFLRTKYGDHNSYKSPDSINMISWANRNSYKEVTEYYEGLIALRKAHPAFRMTTGKEVNANIDAYVKSNNVVAYTLKNNANGDAWKNIVVIYNGNNTVKEVKLPSTADWKIVVNDKKAGTVVLNQLSAASSVQVAPLSMMVLYDEGTNYEPIPKTITLTPSTLGIATNQSKMIKAVVKDQMGAVMSGQKIIWTAQDDTIASVDSIGKVTAKKVGKTAITVSCGDATAILPVEVVNALTPTKMELASPQDYVYEGYKLQLSAKVYDQFNQEMLGAKVAWQSSDPSVASINTSGEVTGIVAGEVTLTATAGTTSETLNLVVKAYEKRYLILEYIRPDKDYTDWNLWVWGTGAKNDQIDFTEITEDKAIAVMELGPDADRVGFLVRKGTDWNTAKQDITSDRFIPVQKDQTIVKARVTSMVQEIEVLAPATAPQILPQEDSILFYYRDNNLFKTDQMDTIQKVEVEINGKLYDMAYDAKNELFKYTYKGLESGKYYYCYYVTDAFGNRVKKLDPNNVKVENGLSVIEYQKLDVKVTGEVKPGAFNFRESAVLHIKAEAVGEDANKQLEIDKITVDLTGLGGKAGVVVDKDLKAITLTATETTTAGLKQLPIQVYDVYGNIYKGTADVTINPQTSVGKDHFDWDEAVIYFMLTDRFNNGDTSNDSNKVNVADKGAYHGGDFKGVTSKLDYLKNLGINTIWITPIVDNIDFNVLAYSDEYSKQPGQVGSDVSYYGYHGYWAKNFEALNPELGTIEDFHTLIDEAHARNMKIMVDVVINHTGYGMKSGDTPEANGGPSGLAGFPTSAEQDVFSGMLRTDGSTDEVYGELAGLPDFITEKSEVRSKIIEWQVKWVEELGKTSQGNTIDYFRIDTAKHVDKTTLQAFKNALSEVKPNFRYIVEAWLSGNEVDTYLNSGLADSVLNFDFKEIAKDFVNGRLEEAEAKLQLLNEKATSAATYGNFLGSHDEDGFLYSLGMQNTDKLLVAATLQATSKGQPVIYYGEEIGQSGKNNWPYYDNRYDMDWSKANESNFILKHYQKVFGIRAKYSEIFSKGTRKQVAGSNSDQYIAFERSYGEDTLVVAVNNAKTNKEITLKVPYKVGSTVTDEYSGKTYIVTKDETVLVTLPNVAEGGTVILSGKKATTDNNGGSSGGSSNGTSSEGTTTLPKVQVTQKVLEEKPNLEQVKDQTPYTAISNLHQLQIIDEKGKNIEKLESGIEVTIPLTAEQKAAITDKRKVGVYQITDSGKLIFKGGQLTDEGITFKMTESGQYAVMMYEKTFDDLDLVPWAKDSIEVLAARHIAMGKTENRFDPKGTLTRAEFAAYLCRMLNINTEDIQNEGQFKDIQGDSWYSGSVIALKELGLISGYADNSFKPNKPITREELAALLVKAYTYSMNMDLEKIPGYDTQSFNDMSQVATWAQVSVKAAKALGLVTGNGDNQYLPQKTATRAEMARMLVMFLEKTGQY